MIALGYYGESEKQADKRTHRNTKRTHIGKQTAHQAQKDVIGRATKITQITEKAPENEHTRRR